MKKIIFLILLSSSALFAQNTKRDSLWLVLKPFVGIWTGDGEGEPCKGKYEGSYQLDFDNTPVQTTIGDIKKNVPMVKLTEEEFTTAILQRIPPTPANYLSIVEKNIKGDFTDINPVDLEAGANRCAIS